MITVFFTPIFPIDFIRSRALIASARQALGQNVKIRMSLPDKYSRPDSMTMNFVEEYNVEVRAFTAKLGMAKGATFPKVDAACESFETNYALLVAPDMIFLNEAKVENLPRVNLSTVAVPLDKYFDDNSIHSIESCLNDYSPYEVGAKRYHLASSLRKSSCFLFDTRTNIAHKWRGIATRICNARVSEKIKKNADKIALSAVAESGEYEHADMPNGWAVDVSRYKDARLVHYGNILRTFSNPITLKTMKDLCKITDDIGLSIFEDLTVEDLAYFDKKMLKTKMKSHLRDFGKK